MKLYDILEAIKISFVEISRLLWFMPDKTEVEKMVRRICTQEGMTPAQTETIVAIIWAESNMNPKAIGKLNKDGSRDYGICQFNTRWWIGPGKAFPSTQYVLDNPEKCVRVMCRHIKQTGRYKDWSAFNNGSYLKYLKKVA